MEPGGAITPLPPPVAMPVFHGIDMIAAMTPEQKTFQVLPPHITSQLDISEQSKVSIIDYKFAKHARENAKFVNMPDFPERNDSIDLLWELSFHFKQATPGWKGMSISSTMKTTIRESLQFDICLCWICTQVTEHAYFQPLYQKAAEIIQESPSNSHLKSIVLLLGCFHTFMNLLGAIGTLLEDTGNSGYCLW